jgi:Outer membrane protein beta-barrel domain
MKNQFIVTLLIVCVSATVAMAQSKKPTTTAKKPTTTVKSSAPKTTTTKKTTTTTTTTTTPVVTPPPVVEEKKTTTTTTTITTPTQSTTTTTPANTTTTTTIQSSGPSKGKKTSEPKPEKVREPKPEKVRAPREPSGSYSGGVKFGIRAEASQLISFQSGGTYDISPGVNAGLFVNIPFNEVVSIQPEVLYSMQVAKVDPLKATVNSILAPVTFNFNLGHGNTKFVISPGGYANYWLSASNTKSGVTVDADLTGIDKFYYGAVLGLGVKINSKLLIETRAFYDLKESNNKEILATFGIGYLF